MPKIYSWKLTDTKNAYLYIPGSKKHITERITDNSIITNIIEKVGSWTETKYKKAFDEMNVEIKEEFGAEIPYSESFFNEKAISNVVILSSSNDGNKEDMDFLLSTLREEIMNELFTSVNSIKEELFEEYKSLKEENKNHTYLTINNSKNKLDEALREVEKIKKDIEARFSKALSTLNRASKIIELENNDIDVESIKVLFKTAYKNKEWLEFNSSDLENIKKDYRQLSMKFANDDKNINVFETVLEKVSSMEDTIKTSETKVKEATNLIHNKLDTLEPVLGKGIDKNFSYKTETGNLIIVDNENITLKSEKTNSEITIKDDGIHLSGDIFINGKKI